MLIIMAESDDSWEDHSIDEEKLCSDGRESSSERNSDSLSPADSILSNKSLTA